MHLGIDINNINVHDIVVYLSKASF